MPSLEFEGVCASTIFLDEVFVPPRSSSLSLLQLLGSLELCDYVLMKPPTYRVEMGRLGLPCHGPARWICSVSTLVS